MADDRWHDDHHAPLTGEPGDVAAGAGDDPSVLSLGEAAAALGLSERRLRRAIGRGELAAVNHDGPLRLRAKDLVQYARSQNLPVPILPRARVVALPVAADAVPALPFAGTPLIGRQAELERLGAWLSDPAIRLITLTGPGGIGKTRLALAAAESAQRAFVDGAIFIDLSSVSRAEDALPAIAQALGLRERAGLDRRSQVAGFLRGKQVLLVLDNLEQIIDAAPEIAQLTVQARGVTLLVTSRAPLRVRGEREVPVPPLPLPTSHATPDQLLAADAGQLFVERAREHNPAFVVDEQSAPLIAEICARLDGLPLALELAAARTKLLPPRQLRDRLEHTLPLLIRGSRDAPPRHQTMRNAIAWTYDMLTPEQQRFFRSLAVFAGGFTLEAAEHVGGDSLAALGGDAALRGERGRDDAAVSYPVPPIPPSPPEAKPSPPPLDLLHALLDQSMIVCDVGLDGEPRYRLLETIRAYGLERLGTDEDSPDAGREGLGGEAAARDAHAGYFVALARALRPMVVTEAAREPLQRLAADEPNLRDALAWLDDHGPAADFVSMVAACSNYWTAFSLLREGGVWIERALARRDDAEPPDRARLLIGAGKLLTFTGDVMRAEAASAEGLSLSRAVDDPFDLAIALTTHGAFLNTQERYVEAEDLLHEGRTVAAAITDTRLRAIVVGRALANLSVTARGHGNLALATSLCEEALACYQGHGLDLAETRILMDLADIAWRQGDHLLVAERYQTCLAQTGAQGDMRVVAVALEGIARAATAWSQPRTALLLYGAANALRERTGLAMIHPGEMAAAERDLATLREALRDDQDAATWAEGRALPLAEALQMAAAVAPLAAAPPANPAPKARSPLTRRQREVLRLLAAGQSDREIAETLFVSPRTVSWHVGAILGKLEASTRLQAVNQAREAGLI